MLQDIWNAPPGFRPTKSAPSSPAKPLGVSRTRSSESFHVTHKVPVGDTPYVKAKNVQLVDKDPERSIPLFWAAINGGDRVDSALKDMAIVMKQQNRPEEAIEAIKSLRHRCSDQAQEALDNILLDLYKRCGRLDDQIALLKHKLFLIQRGFAFNGKRTKTARSQGKKFQVSVEQEANRLLGNLGWALMQKDNYLEAEDVYRRALSMAPDNNKMCNLGICLMKQGRISEAKDILRQVKPAVVDGPRGMDSHLKAYERAQQMLKDLESEMMNRGGDPLEQSRLFNAFLGSSSIWQPQPCKDSITLPPTNSFKHADDFADENISANMMHNQTVATKHRNLPPAKSFKHADDFADENTSANIMHNQTVPTQHRSIKPVQGNLFNIEAPSFFSSKVMKDSVVKNPTGNQYNDNLKRTRSANSANAMGWTVMEEWTKPCMEPKRPETKAKKLTFTSERTVDKVTGLLPDNNDFEEAILAVVLGKETDNGKTPDEVVFPRKVEKRLKVFEDITLSLSPKA